MRPVSAPAFELYARNPIHTLHGRGLPHGETAGKRRESGANCILLFGSARTGGVTTEPLRKVVRRPGFLRLLDRADRAKLVQWALKGARCTQAVHERSICTHAVPLTHSIAKAIRTEEPAARGERMGQTAFSCSAARALVGQLSRSAVSTITAPQAVTQVSVLKPEDDHKPTGVQ